MGRRTAAAVLSAVISGAPGLGLADPTRAPSIAVVVGTESPVRELTLDTLRDVYLRRLRVWPDGSRVVPVNLPGDDPVREHFSRRVLGRPPRDLLGYWNDRYFEGIRPPLVLRSPEAVCAYLETEPAAVGYVGLAQAQGCAGRVLLLLEDDRG